MKQVHQALKNFYKHAKKVWIVFERKTLGEYHDLFIQADTSQLTDVFENFRLLCLKEYQLNPAYFDPTHSLAFEGINMVLITKKGIRGGLTQVVKKNAIANNKCLPNYDKSKRMSLCSIWTQMTYTVVLSIKRYH